MSRRDSVPSYRLHKQSGQAVVTLTDAGSGCRRDVLLGRHGCPESRTEYLRVLAEWEANSRRLPAKVAASDLSVGELILAFWNHAEQHYRYADGRPTGELNDYRLSLKPLRELYGHTPAAAFGPLALKAVRQRLVESGLCRGVVNQRVGRLRRVFRWAVEEELVPPSVLHGLQAVRGLQHGRSAARETEPVRPVPEAFVRATLPFLLPPAAAMVEIQLLTGMRPGEVVAMRGLDIDMTGPVWLYRPGSDAGPLGQHKTAHHGHQRVIAIGPRAREIVRRFLKPDVRAYLFSPRDGLAQQRAERRRNRKTKVPPSQARRARKAKPLRQPRDCYTVTSYGRAVARAALAADRRAHALDPTHPADRRIVPHWHPHQLRHTKATEIRREFGLDAARVVLGHRSPQITELYAELDVGRAASVMEKLG